MTRTCFKPEGEGERGGALLCFPPTDLLFTFWHATCDMRRWDPRGNGQWAVEWGGGQGGKLERTGPPPWPVAFLSCSTCDAGFTLVESWGAAVAPLSSQLPGSHFKVHYGSLFFAVSPSGTAMAANGRPPSGRPALSRQFPVNPPQIWSLQSQPSDFHRFTSPDAT